MTYMAASATARRSCPTEPATQMQFFTLGKIELGRSSYYDLNTEERMKWGRKGKGKEALPCTQNGEGALRADEDEEYDIRRQYNRCGVLDPFDHSL